MRGGGEYQDIGCLIVLLFGLCTAMTIALSLYVVMG
jgi:hypothetical protein